jgi:hypothetical protein
MLAVRLDVPRILHLPSSVTLQALVIFRSRFPVPCFPPAFLIAPQVKNSRSSRFTERGMPSPLPRRRASARNVREKARLAPRPGRVFLSTETRPPGAQWHSLKPLRIPNSASTGSARAVWLLISLTFSARPELLSRKFLPKRAEVGLRASARAEPVEGLSQASGSLSECHCPGATQDVDFWRTRCLITTFWRGRRRGEQPRVPHALSRDALRPTGRTRPGRVAG